MIPIEEILEKVTYLDYTGSSNEFIDKVVSLDQVENQSNAITWCNDKNLLKLVNLKSDSIFIVSNSVDDKIKNKLSCIVVENPRRIFQEILTVFFVQKRKPMISNLASIDDTVKLGNNIFIGHNVVIEEGCSIGDNVVILHNTVVLKDTVIGNNVVIGSNNTIGGVGFGYEKNKEGDFELIPHIGNVIIRDNVEIGNNTCIDRAVLGSTLLAENVKIDNLVHIAHGVQLARNSVVIANAMVAGSVKVGENSWIAPSAAILNQKTIGKNALVGLGAVVTKDVEDNTIVAGNPAKFIRNI